MAQVNEEKYEIIKKMGGYDEVNKLLKKDKNIGLIRYLSIAVSLMGKLDALMIEYRRDHNIAVEPIN